MTTPAVVDPDALRHLGMVIHKIRPQWDLPGIRAALENAAGHPYPDLALVAISSARDPSARTPAVIPQRCDNGWTATIHDERAPATQQPDNTADMRCRSCGMWVVRGEQHVCARVGDVHAGAAAARAQLAAARAALKEAT